MLLLDTDCSGQWGSSRINQVIASFIFNLNEKWIYDQYIIVKSCNKYGISYVTFPAELKGFYASFAFI